MLTASPGSCAGFLIYFKQEVMEMNMEKLIELDKKHFIHPTSLIQQQQEHGPKMIVEKGEGIYLTDTNGNVYIDAMSSLWNVNIGHGREELAEVAAEQMKNLPLARHFLLSVINRRFC